MQLNRPCFQGSGEFFTGALVKDDLSGRKGDAA